MFWHGSPKQWEVLLPQICHLLGGKAVVFATPSRTIAAVFSRKWTSRDFDFGHVTDDGTSSLVLTEKRSGAFSEIFEGKEAFLYGVDHRRFHKDERLGMYNHEFVSTAVEPVIKTVVLKDVGDWLRNRSFNLKIHFFK